MNAHSIHHESNRSAISIIVFHDIGPVPYAETTTFLPSTTAARLSKSNAPSSSGTTSSLTNDILIPTTRASRFGTADHSKLIAGLVLGVVAFVTLIAVITVIAMKRYLRYT